MRPLLKEAADFNKNSPMGWSRAALINISSLLGSLTNNVIGGFLEYRESKVSFGRIKSLCTVRYIHLKVLEVLVSPQGIDILASS